MKMWPKNMAYLLGGHKTLGYNILQLYNYIIHQVGLVMKLIPNFMMKNISAAPL